MRSLPAVLAASAFVLVAALLLLRSGCAAEPDPSDPGLPRQGTVVPRPPAAADRPRVGPRAAGPGGAPADPLAPGEPPVEASAVPGEPPLAHAGELPESELGTGDCVLRLRLADAESGAAVASPVRLWRLGVPASARFTAGDHVQRKLDVPEDGATVSGLPAGRYRVEVDAARASADAAPEFALSGTSEQTVQVAMPRSLPIRCVVLDEHGAPLQAALHRAGTSGWEKLGSRPAPAWTGPRRAVHPGAPAAAPSSTGSGVQEDAMPAARVAGQYGFELGVLQETTQVTAYKSSHMLQVEGRNDVRVWAASQDGAEPVYLGVAVPLSQLVAHVRLPDGTSPLDAGGKVTAQSVAVPRKGTPGPDWRSIPVDVRVEVPGHTPVRFAWRLADAARVAITLKPEPADPERE